MLSTPISAFKSATSTEPATVTLGTWLYSKRHMEQIKRIREETNDEEKSRLKRSLPAATISGTFTKRSREGLAHYNGLVCLDFDRSENPHLTGLEMRSLLSEFEEVAYAALSVSGKGCYAIIQTDNTDPDFHPEVVDFLGGLFKTEGLIYDRACKDVCRLRFISFDPEAYINPSPVVFKCAPIKCSQTVQKILPPPRPIRVKTTSTNSRVETRVQDFIQVLENSCRDITSNYDDWIRIGFALANEFGLGGEEYYQRISYFHPKYNRQECSKKYLNLVRTGSSIKIATFFKIMQSHGITLDK